MTTSILRRKRVCCTLILVIVAVVAFGVVVTSPAMRFHRQHGIRLPRSSVNVQFQQSGRLRAIFDSGAVSLFEIASEDLNAFVEQLDINSRNSPVASKSGDPLQNGYNVWPTTSTTFVPGDLGGSRLERKWDEKMSVFPIEMLSCESPVGDWLHVELWSIGPEKEKILVKVYTDRN